MEVGVHPRFENWNAAKLGQLAAMCVVVKGAGNEHVEVCIAAFASGFDKIRARHGTELRPDENAGASFGLAFEVAAFGANVTTRPGSERGIGDLVFLVGLLHSSAFQVFQNHLWKTLLRAVFAVPLSHARIDQFLILIHAQHAMRTEALDGEWAGYSYLLFVVVRFVVEIFKLSLGCDGGINLLLPLDARLPPFCVQVFSCLRQG